MKRLVGIIGTSRVAFHPIAAPNTPNVHKVRRFGLGTKIPALHQSGRFVLRVPGMAGRKIGVPPLAGHREERLQPHAETGQQVDTRGERRAVGVKNGARSGVMTGADAVPTAVSAGGRIVALETDLRTAVAVAAHAQAETQVPAGAGLEGVQAGGRVVALAVRRRFRRHPSRPIRINR